MNLKSEFSAAYQNYLLMLHKNFFLNVHIFVLKYDVKGVVLLVT